jgi:hypothetical protein
MASILGVETLQHTNGTTAATIDSSGNIDMPQVLTSKAVAFSVYHSSSASVAATASYVKLPYNSTNYDSHSAFNFTNDQYVVPIAGVYVFEMSVLQLSNMSSNISFHLNGTSKSPLYRAITGSTEQNVTGSVILDCNVNDTVDVRIRTTSGGGSYYITHGGFHGHLIGT